VGTSGSVALTTLLDRVAWTHVAGNQRREVTSIAIDSRSVEPGALFVALRGSRTDGHRFAADAVAKGASVVVAETVPPNLPASITLVRVPDSRRALSALAAAFYGEPSHALDVIGVTGTNGKTTTTHLVASILNTAGLSCGIVGTVGAEFGAKRWGLANTTPLPPALHELLARMRDEGAKAVAMEVSSHALALDRVDDVRFAAAVLTNVTRDHLDFHETLDAYAAAKRRLFSLAPVCVINLDDEIGRRWAVELGRERREVITYGMADGATIVPKEIVSDSEGTSFTANGQRYELCLPGRFNVWNALAAICVARSLGIDSATTARGLAAVATVPGRMERIVAGGVAVVVDYAHTPDALENALNSLRETAEGRLAVVFGCGGDRDRGKRPEMGAVAARLADRVYVTSDNPRTEPPRAIADAIVAGIGAHDRVVELDRRRAIERAIAESQVGDVVLIAGKGHEAYQIVGDRILPFDDAAIARTALSARNVLR
jgi:UDP-N-acetylmuramoyl-L-alanyl-D-glutamate--2,6-diaminopimelate ligase